tara:strand:- start:283 stop:549 length:267 start_codon:yes stop_codon:yes gene_type:complete
MIKLPTPLPDDRKLPGDPAARARSEIIIQSLSKLSQLLRAYQPDVEIVLFDGGCEISSPSQFAGAFMPFDGGDGELLLMEQLEEFELS